MRAVKFQLDCDNYPDLLHTILNYLVGSTMTGSSQAADDNEFLCRNAMNCIWLDKDLMCHNQKLDITCNSIYKTWFGGDVEDISGRCECQKNFWWDEEELLCQQFSDHESGMQWWSFFFIAISVLMPVCACCVLLSKS